MPIAASTTLFHFSYSAGKSTVIEEPMQSLNIESLLSEYEVGFTHPLVESLSRRVSLGLAYAEQKSNTTLSGMPFSFTPGEVDGVSKCKTVRFSQDWSEVGSSSVFSLHSVLNSGQNNNQGGFANAPDTRYIYWNGQASWVHNIMDNGTQLVLRGNMQLTHNSLLPMNRASMGGVNTVRGYRENQLVRDETKGGSVELHYPILTEGKTGRNVQLIPFVDVGIGTNRGEASESLRSVGLAANWRYAGWHADLTLASRLISVAAPAKPTLQDRGIQFQLGYSFF
jgi:hemolysin activation/secretion protein